MPYYKMNLPTKTLTISKNFEKEAINNPNSKEYQIMERCRFLCPDLKIAYYKRKPASQKRYGGMTYRKMENYIKLHKNANELLNMFNLIKEVAKSQKNKLGFVYNWFITQFPDYEEIPEIKNGKIYASVIILPIAEENTIQAEENVLHAA